MMWIYTIIACIASYVIGQLLFAKKWVEILTTVGLNEEEILTNYHKIKDFEKNQKSNKD